MADIVKYKKGLDDKCYKYILTWVRADGFFETAIDTIDYIVCKKKRKKSGIQ